MWKRRKAFILIAFVAAAIVLTAFLTRNREPRYQDRSLSQWYILWTESFEGQDKQSKAQAAEAAYAIRQIGTNSLPIMFGWLKSLYSAQWNPVLELVNKLPSAISESSAASILFSERHKIEPTGLFVVLGPQAAQAIPELTALMYATNNPNLAHAAAFCLAAIGKEGLPPLLTALANPNSPSCYFAASSLSGRFTFGTNIAQAVPLLAQCTTATDEQLARVAIKALGRIKAEPKLAIPALANCLKSTNSFVRQEAIRSLLGFKNQTIPLLLPTLNDPDESVRRTATNCLHFLAPEVLSNAPAH